MGRKCSVDGCLSDSNRPEDMGVTFHKVPMHSDVRPKWMSLCHIPDDKKSVKIIYVCSRHFLRADFCNFKGKKYMLKQGVLPSVFPWDKSKLEAIKAEATIKKEKCDDETNLDVVKEEVEEPILDIKSELNEESNETVEDIKEEPKEELSEVSKPTQEQSNLSTNVGSINFTINSRLEALDFNNEWYPARIVEVDYEESEVLIHFEKFSSKYDEWISMNSSRLRPLQITSSDASVTPSSSKNTEEPERFVVGERCLAAWRASQKFPATVSKVLENDTYEVLFDDGFVKTLKVHRIDKTGDKPLHSSPLFEPIKSSKQDRRDKKKKLNVASLFRKRQKNHDDAPYERTPVKKVKTMQKPESPSLNSPTLDSSIEDIQNWRPLWYKGKPVGTESVLDMNDGPKNTVIVPDPRLPEGWTKHLLRRNVKGSGVKWESIIVNPDNKKFRSKTDVKLYLEQHPSEGLTEDMFDFSLVRSNKPKKVAKPVVPDVPQTEEQIVPEPPEEVQPEEAQENREEDNSNCLKILFEDDAYKCPIEGCGKTFRRENLAQMHVKHYHPEYTKFLDSTPNVADLAYARTVGENLDKSPGPSSKPPVLKPAVKVSTPKSSKLPHSPIAEMPDLKPVGAQSPSMSKGKDAELIKLLNSKFPEKKDPDPSQTPAGSPIGYPDLKLKEFLGKSDGGALKRDEINRPFSSGRTAGIKTLLPVVRQQASDGAAHHQPPSEETPKHTGKRKRVFSENIDHHRVKRHSSPPLLLSTTPAPSQNPIPMSLPISSSPTCHSTTPIGVFQNTKPAPPTAALIPVSDVLPPQLPPSVDPDCASVPPPPNNIIIEGGEVIKIVRMKQEEIINCTCGFTEEDGLMIQCELCLCWQHAYCNNIERESQVPDRYICYICQNPFRERLSRKYYHDQDWLKQGILPTASYHTKDDEVHQKRFEKMKKCHDLSGGLQELKEYMHSLAIKLKIAEAKNHPKLYLWSKAWEKSTLPEKLKQVDNVDDTKPKMEDNEDHQYIKTEDPEKQEKTDESMLMMILKDGGKEVMPKLDLNLLMDNNMTQLPMIPQPEAAIDSTVCRDNLLQHIRHQESLVEERLDDFEKQIENLEECMDMEADPNYPKMRLTLQMLMRDLEKLREFSVSTTI